MDLLSKLLQAVLEVALPILVSALAAWLIAKTKEIFERMKSSNPDMAYMMEQIARCAVNAAEQLYKGHMRGDEKKEYAIKVIESFLKSKNINLDVEVIGAYIEAAVRDMNRYPVELPVVTYTETASENTDAVPTTVQE